MKIKFTVTGMTCAACSSRVEKVAAGVQGVAKAEVNLLLPFFFFVWCRDSRERQRFDPRHPKNASRRRWIFGWWGVRRPPPVAETGSRASGRGRKNRGKHKPDDFFGNRNRSASASARSCPAVSTKSLETLCFQGFFFFTQYAATPENRRSPG